VEIVRRAEDKGNTRSGTSPSSVVEPSLSIEVGFFFQKNKDRRIQILTENSRLRSKSDRYFVFFRPLQDCYAYVVQEDSQGNIALLFPDENSDGHVKKGQDYWLPNFGMGYTLDNVKGREMLYLLVTSWPLSTEIDDLSLKEQAHRSVRSLKSRTIYIEPADATAPPILDEELNKKPHIINPLLTRVKGQGGWVKMVGFEHE
jgi:hypothetical protein